MNVHRQLVTLTAEDGRQVLTLLQVQGKTGKDSAVLPLAVRIEER